ncbi:MAG TPA: adenine phosphoribosyltransferase, partial [Candidatus Thermoplasmatota archaeon]|nr:adenine phosphoribosyltransferase [Candidatus Thermoplasmatota archaeon]
LARTLRDAPVVRMRNYDYFVHPITDGIPEVDPDLLSEVVEELRARLPTTFDRFLAPEAMGLPLATALSLATGRPFLVARKRAYGLPGEIVIQQTTGYGKSSFHIVGLRKGERVVLVDDVVSTGGTIRCLAQACRQAGATLEKVLIAINKDHDLEALGREVGAPIEAVTRIRIEGGKVRLEA